MPIYSIASRIYSKVVDISHVILNHFKINHGPHLPINRLRPWADRRGPKGVAYHFTGGPSGLKTMKWFNKPSWNNRVSSCNVLILDRLSGKIGDMWEQLADDEVLKWFPVPAIILLEWDWSAWCTNWANAKTLGVENRNCGSNIIANQKRYDIGVKQSTMINGVHWEQYTREQIAANISIARIVAGMRGSEFSLDWIVGHSMIWSTKSDPGPLFPLELIRFAAALDLSAEDLEWLSAYPQAPTEDEDDETWWDINHEVRDEDCDQFWQFIDPNIRNDMHTEVVADMLGKLGYNCEIMLPSRARLQRFVKWFQKSTKAYGVDRKLIVDGIAGPKTRLALQRRLSELRL